MPIHARDILTAQEQFDSLEMLNHVTKAGNRGFTELSTAYTASCTFNV